MYNNGARGFSIHDAFEEETDEAIRVYGSTVISTQGRSTEDVSIRIQDPNFCAKQGAPKIPVIVYTSGVLSMMWGFHWPLPYSRRKRHLNKLAKRRVRDGWIAPTSSLH
ncbi:uncharacterized protein [Drosophila takahashii]|uniref:uncharacterized protein isoform X2 n=1 Tax=Drosophila takahashii TaxID=29030 RepID=UPI003898D662